ncbi:hypothetical protein KIN20_038313 [Parelaphostrongylus tenuis]|uniref:Uncharacterized protein n=1 Tax=Parelaphostrongylus tenuis TaxID=148309 RepID=A0AAD5RF88_PARTN|nr:hypothetical protein KIN20_038313 [Parelaphostrongylus tenuis]
MKSAEFNRKTQQANLLLISNLPIKRISTKDLDLEDKPRSERPRNLKNEGLIAALKDTTKEINDKVDELNGVEAPSHLAYGPGYVPSDSFFPSVRHFLKGR